MFVNPGGGGSTYSSSSYGSSSSSSSSWSGLGARVLLDAKEGNAGGVNFTYGFDVFPAEPVVISASIDLGNLGRAFAWHGRGTVGANLGWLELYGGYDAFGVSDVVFRAPVVGMRVWL